MDTRRGGFTLIEIAAVMAITTMVLAMAVGAHYAWKRAAALDAARLRAESCFALARHRAVASGHPTVVILGDANAPVQRTSLRLDGTQGAADAAAIAFETELQTGGSWCCVLEITNVLDEAAAFALVEEGADTEFPLVGPVAMFPTIVQWADDESGSTPEYPRRILFLPDGTASTPGDADGASLTNVLNGAGSFEAAALHDAETRAARARVLVLDPWLGALRSLSREERQAYFGGAQADFPVPMD